MKFDRTKMLEALRRVVQRMHYPLEVMLVSERVNDFAPPLVMNLLRKAVVISG